MPALALSEIIPSQRRIQWQGNVGIPGGVPNRATIFADVKNAPYRAAGNGTTDDTGAIQAAINACPAGQVVYIPAGTYRLKGSLSIKRSITLRGAGRGQTILNTFSGGRAIALGSSTPFWYGGPGVGITNITGGHTKGSTSITVANASGISVGSLLMIDQLNDSSFVTINGGWASGGSGNATWVSRANGTRAMGQTVEVKSVSGKTIGISPLYWNYSAGLSPQAVVIPASSVLRNAGVEDLTVRNNGAGQVNFFMNACAYSWFKNVEGDFCNGDHVSIETSYRCEIRDSYFHDAYLHTAGTYDSDVCIQYKSSGCLIENNILFRLHLGFLLTRGASGNVIAYNYSHGHFDSYAPNLVSPDSAGHGAHPLFNLWEGNISPKIHGDSVWGSNSHGTFFRNWIKGTGEHQEPTGPGRQSYNASAPKLSSYQGNRAVCLDSKSLYYNVVGNVLGTAGYTQADTYMVVAPQYRAYEERHIFSLGYGGGGDGDPGSAPGNSDLPAKTLLNHGNWDSATETQKWDAKITDRNLPDSLYLTEKPSWFDNFTWPPFDPANPTTSMSDVRIPAGHRYVKSPLPIRNISTRGFVQNGDQVLIGGFIVAGTGQKKVAVRALGPSLPLSHALRDPIIELRDAGGRLLAKNDNWRSSQQSAIMATGLSLANDGESTLIATLNPGSYTAVVRGANNATGIGLVEIYDLDHPGSGARLANVSTRGRVLGGDGVLIGGLILGSGDWSTPIVARALGPSLGQFGISGVLADPTLELRNSNGALIASNDNWKNSAHDEIQKIGLAPSDAREPAILKRLAPGHYTVIVAGKNGTNGIGLVEIFNLD